MRKRFLSIFLVLILCLAYVPVPVFAADLYVSTADDLDALTVSPGDTIRFSSDINAPAYNMDLSSSIGDGDTVTIDLQGHYVVMNSLKMANGGSLNIIDSTGSNTGEMSVKTFLHEGNGALTLDNDLTVGVEDSFVWISDQGIALHDQSMLFLYDAVVTVDYISDPTSFWFSFDAGDGSIVSLAAGDISPNDPAHASTIAAALNLPSQFEASGDNFTGDITIKRNLPNGEQETYTGLLQFKHDYPEAMFTTPPTATSNVYNGEEQELFTAGVTDMGDVWYSADGTNWSQSIPTQTEAGTANTGAYMIVGNGDWSNSIVTGQTIGISPYTTAVTVNIKGNTETFIYDGYEHSVDGFTIESISPSDAPFAETDIAVTGMAYASGTDADTYDMVMPTFENGRAASVPNVTFNVTEGYVTIEPREVTLTSGSASKKRDGTPLTEETVTVGGDGWAPGEGATYNNFASITDVGSTDNTFNYTLNAGMLEGNYNITQEYGVLTVTDLTPVTAKADNITEKYGDLEGRLTYKVYDASDNDITAEVDTALEAAGEEIRTVCDTSAGAGDYVISFDSPTEMAGYSFTYVNGTCTVEPRAVTLTSGTASKVYDGTALTEETVTVGGDGWASGEGATYSGFASITDTGSTDNTFAYTLDAGTSAGNYNITQAYGTLTVESSGGGGGGGGGDASEEPAPEEESYDFTQPEEGVGSGVEDEEAWTWGERANLAEDTATLYMILSNNSVSEEEDSELPYPEIGTEHFLTKEEVWELPKTDHEKKTHTVDTVLVCQEDEPLYTANGDGKVDESSFGNSEFYVVGVGTGDTRIDYPNLVTGDVVKSTTFNGIYITKVPKTGNPNFDSDLIKVKEDVVASFRSFEFDHPEVFWLTDSVRVRAVTVSINGVQTAYLFIVLVDNSGFCMRMDEYAAPGAIEAAIKQRDAAADAIIAQIPKNASTREVIANLNKWFTLHNEYNRSADLNTIGFAPHRSLKALVGGEGTAGPVCDGYSRAFKMICDRIGIPVILDTGVASRGSHSEMHMWMRIQVDGVWYGMDCTWDDPVVAGVSGIISGFENEKYMLVGDDTVVDGQKFGISHPSNKAVGGTTGVLFASLMVNVDEIEGYVAMPFSDVRLSDWYYDYVKSAFGKQLMGGTSSGIFSPQGTATRGQIVQILYNAAGQPAVDEVKVEGWFGKAATWAMEQGIVAGYADGEFHGEDTVTREQLATILWAYEGAPQAGGELAFADAAKVSDWAKTAMLWAKDEGIIGGKPGNLADPQGTATRAEIATIFSNYLK